MKLKPKNQYTKIYGENLHKYRKEKDFTLLQLAEKLNISEGQMCVYEKGRNEPSFENMFKLAFILNKKIEDFFK